MGMFLLEGGSKAFQPCRKTSQLCRERQQQQHPQQKQDPDVPHPGGIEGLVPTRARLAFKMLELNQGRQLWRPS